jgi:hypothetical protein
LGDGYDDLDDIPNSPTFLNAFIEGALEAWQKLAPKIEGAHRAAQAITASAASSAIITMPAQPVSPSSMSVLNQNEPVSVMSEAVQGELVHRPRFQSHPVRTPLMPIAGQAEGMSSRSY